MLYVYCINTPISDLTSITWLSHYLETFFYFKNRGARLLKENKINIVILIVFHNATNAAFKYFIFINSCKKKSTPQRKKEIE